MVEREFDTFAQWQRHHREAERYSLRELSKQLINRSVPSSSHSAISKREADDSGPDEISPRPPREYVEAFARLTRANVNEGLRLAGYSIQTGASMSGEEMARLWPALVQEQDGSIRIGPGLPQAARENLMRHYELLELAHKAEEANH